MKHKNIKYKTILFDLYGTLVDIHTDEESGYVWEKMCLFYGYYQADYTPEALRESFTMFIKEEQEKREEIQMEHVFGRLFAQKGVSLDAEMAVCAARMFRVLSTEYIHLYPGTKELLEALKKQGRKIYLLTNAQRVFTWHELKMLGIADCFDDIFISSDYGVKKPNVRFFSAPLKKYNLKKSDCLMIGNDEICDIGGARLAGMDSIYLHTNLSPDYQGMCRATRMIMEQPESMEQLLRVIEEAEMRIQN